MAALVEMRGITKAFPGVLANDCIDLTVEEGEIHSLLGENGAGKTTLMNILYGLYRPQAGEVRVGGERARFESPADAIRRGIGMVHQHFMLVPTLTVTENIVLGLGASRWPCFLDLDAAAARIAALADRFGFVLDPRAKVWQLSVGAQQRVEIVKALYREARVLILDEPTSVLTPQEAEHLFDVLRSLRRDGHAVIFISHKLDEVLRLSDRITVLRDGRVVATVETAEVDQHALARMMVGRDVLFRLEKEEREPGPPVLEVDAVSALNDRGLRALSDVSLTVHAGEIVAVAGVDGNGQRELAECVLGLRPIVHGSVRLTARDITRWEPQARRAAGLGLIPQDRQRMGLILPFTIAENILLGTYHAREMTHAGLLDRPAIRAYAERLIAQYDVRAPGPDAVMRHLSGGNQQKVVVAREMARAPRALIAVQPTRGLDVGASEFVRGQLLRERARGAAILLISTELEEVLTLADRVAILCAGEVMGVVRPGEVDVAEIGLMMAGARRLPAVAA